MARAKEQKNGRLEEALAIMLQNMATLVQTQAAFVADKRETDKELADLRRQNNERFARIDERFVQMDQRLAAIEAVLREHNRILERLPDAVRDKIGFKAPP
jgi:hypothetical protein